MFVLPSYLQFVMAILRSGSAKFTRASGKNGFPISRQPTPTF